MIGTEAAPPITSPPAVSLASREQTTSAMTAPAPPAGPANPVQAPPTARGPVPALPAPGLAAPKTSPPTPPVTTPAAVLPDPDATYDTAVDDTAPTPAPIDPEAEAKLTSEITKLWAEQRDGKAFVRRTRANLNALRLELGAKLHAMKAILVRTGRGGGWASYLRTQHLPVTSADRYVAAHEATLAPRQEKPPTGELSIIDEVHQLAQKMPPKVSRLLTTQELVYEFVHELAWNIDVAEAWYTDKGFEIPKTGSDDAPDVDGLVAEPAGSTPSVPDGVAEAL